MKNYKLWVVNRVSGKLIRFEYVRSATMDDAFDLVRSTLNSFESCSTAQPL